MAIKAKGHEWYEVTRDFADRDEARAEAVRIARRDRGHSFTALARVRGVWVVVQRPRHIG